MSFAVTHLQIDGGRRGLVTACDIVYPFRMDILPTTHFDTSPGQPILKWCLRDRGPSSQHSLGIFLCKIRFRCFSQISLTSFCFLLYDDENKGNIAFECFSGTVPAPGVTTHPHRQLIVCGSTQLNFMRAHEKMYEDEIVRRTWYFFPVTWQLTWMSVHKYFRQCIVEA